MNWLLVRTRKSALGVFALAFLSACGSRTREIPLRGSFLVEGALVAPDNSPQLFKQRQISFNWIDRNGGRQPLPNIQLDLNTGKFSFEFKRENLIRKLGSSTPEINALMGAVRPLERLSTLGYEQNETGYIRLEAHSEVGTGSSGEIAFYSQRVSGLPMTASFSTNKTLNIGSSNLTNSKVGLLKVKVINTQGTVVPNAAVSVVPLAVFGVNEQDVRPFDFALQPNYIPISSLTGNDGFATAWPIPTSNKDTKFQISVSHPEYCTQASRPTMHATSLPTLEIVMTPCTPEQRNNSQIDWDVSAPKDIFVSSKAEGIFPAGTLFTNKSQLELQLTNKSSLLRGLTVTVHKGTSAEAEALTPQEFLTFANKILINLPEYYAGGTQNGSFFISLKARLNDEDRTVGRSEFVKTLLGDKVVGELPEVDKSLFTVASPVGSTNKISGLEGIPFTVRFNTCTPGKKIGVFVTSNGISSPNGDAKLVKFQDCNPEGNTFFFKDVAYAFNDIGGSKVMQLFHTDRYLNESKDDSDPSRYKNRITDLHVDFGRPNVASAPLASVTAIVANTTVVPLTGTPPLVELTPANVSSHAFTFRPNGCGLVNTIGEPSITNPDGTGTTGTEIAKFYVGSSTVYSTMASRAVSCTTEKMALSADAVSFPSDPAASATVSLTLFDHAGNHGTGSLAIPRCVANPDLTNTPEGVCWKPN